MNEPAKVYIVTQGCYSDCRNIGVFTTREKADAAALKTGDPDTTVEEWLLDNQPGAPGHYNYFYAVMDRDGNVRRSEKTTYRGEVDAPERLAQWPSGKNPDAGCWLIHALATDMIHAIKIVNEQRVQLIAENKWGVN